MFSVTEIEIIRLYLRRNREELSEIDLLDVRFSSFFIACSKKTKKTQTKHFDFLNKYLRKAWTKLTECVHLWEVALRGCSSARSCLHTPSPSKCRPSTNVTPCGRKPVTVFLLCMATPFFAVLRLHTHQTTVPSPEPKSRRDWGAKEGSLFFICDNQRRKAKAKDI